MKTLPTSFPPAGEECTLFFYRCQTLVLTTAYVVLGGQFTGEETLRLGGTARDHCSFYAGARTDANMGQSELGDYGGGRDDDRPTDEEAAAVAGNGGENATYVDTSDALFPETGEHVEIAVMQVDYTIEGRGDEERPIVHVFGRTEENDLVHVRVREFEPYFYAPAENVTEGRLMEYDRITGWEETDENGDHFESIRGEKLVKIYGQTPRDVGQIRDEFDHYEADILFPNRLLIDKDITSGIRVPKRLLDPESDRLTIRAHHEELEAVDVDAQPRVNTFDIEVDDRSGFPEDGEEPIICIASHDNYDDEYVLWLYEAPGGNDAPGVLEDYQPIETDSRQATDSEADLNVDIRRYGTEEEMLEEFLEYIDRTDPDVLTGWNFDDFDAPYLIDRLEELEGKTERNLDYNRLSRVDEVWASNWGGPDIKGRVVFDLLYAYQRTKFTELESYRLDDVGERELGVGKERYPGDIGDLWENDPERLLEYNLRDVELCVELDREQNIVAFWNEVRQFVGCKLEDATTPGDAVDMYVLHKLHDKFSLPSKGQQESEDYEGGAVFDPITGVRVNVSVLDLKCFSADTEVLTPHGAENITDIQEGDRIYTLNPDTFECEIQPVAETHEYDNKYGELHHLNGNTHDFKVTENHRFLISSERGWDSQEPADFEFAEYRDITDSERFAFPQHEPMSGRAPDTFELIDEIGEGHVVVYTEDDLRSFRNRMPAAVTESLELVHGSSATLGIDKKVGKYLIPVTLFREHQTIIEKHADHLFLKYDKGHSEMPLSFEMTDWLEFLGWFVTEGSSDPKNGRLTIHQDDEDGRGAICELLDRMDITYNVGKRGINISNRYLVGWLESNCGDGYETKQLPSWVFGLDGTLLERLLETMIRGDGSRTDSGLGKFWTKSEMLKDDIVDLAVRCGQKPTVSKQLDGTWYVSIGKKGSFKKSTNASVEAHDGTVHCITAENNHVVLAGRNGHFQWIGQSLYPMCMVTINASPETKVDPEEYRGETYRAPNGTRFRKEPDGAIREMVDELLTEREEKKAQRNEHEPKSDEYQKFDRQQQAVKVIMNSLYGVLGWDRFRLYDREMGAAVTATGREVINFTEQVTNNFDKNVIYGDTDSVMVSVGDDVTKEEAIERSFEIEEAINSSYDEFAQEELNAAEHRFQIEFEKLYRRFFQAGTKKRYCGHIVWKEGQDVDDIDITGFEYQRSDIAPITKKVQKNVIEMIVTGEETEEIKSYVHDVIDDFQVGNADPEDIGIPGGIGKRLDNYDTDTAHVRGAKYANRVLGTNFQRGSKPKRLYIDRVHADFFERIEAEQGDELRSDPVYQEFKRDPDVICFEYADQLPEEFEIDWEKMLDKTLKGPIARILEALGISWDEVKSGQEQTGLGQYT